MSTIKVTLESDADGTLHLPLPPGMEAGRFHVIALLEPVAQPDAMNATVEPKVNLKGFGSLRGKIEMAPDFDEPLEDFKDYME